MWDKNLEYPTRRQLEILGLMVKGQTYNEIAQELGVTPSAVSSHMLNLRQRLGAKTRDELIAKALRLGLLPGNDSANMQD